MQLDAREQHGPPRRSVGPRAQLAQIKGLALYVGGGFGEVAEREQPADRVCARVGDQEVIAGPGSYLLKPRGLMHTFWNAGPGPARLLEVISPAGFETYFAELAEAGDPGRRQELATKYGVTYSEDWVAELTSRYDLTLLGH